MQISTAEKKLFISRIAKNPEEKKSYHLCPLCALPGQLTATFRTHRGFVSVFIHVVTGWVLTSTLSSCCGQTQILKNKKRLEMKSIHFLLTASKS